MVATHINKIKHSMLCVTGVYLRDIMNIIFVILHLNVSHLSACVCSDGPLEGYCGQKLCSPLLFSFFFFLDSLSILSTVGYSSEIMYLRWSLYTLMPGDSYRRWFTSLLLCHLFYVRCPSGNTKCLTLAIFPFKPWLGQKIPPAATNDS